MLHNLADKQPKNLFLASLSTDCYKRLEPHLEVVDMTLGFLVYAPFEPIPYIYFPETCVISLVTVLENGAAVETGIIGFEGFAGIDAVLSNDLTTKEATSQVSGKGLRIKTEIFKNEFQRGGELQNLSLRFIFAFIAQISQNGACLLLHSIENRLARWLLMIQDRTGEDKINLTQEFIALMLGVHRPSVSHAASALQKQGMIRYNRGRITILDRLGLEKSACECYRTIKDKIENYLKTG